MEKRIIDTELCKMIWGIKIIKMDHGEYLKNKLWKTIKGK